MVGINNVECDKHIQKFGMTALVTTTAVGGISAYAFHKQVKNKKLKTLKTIGVYLATSMASGLVLKNLYYDNLELTKTCEPYYLKNSGNTKLEN